MICPRCKKEDLQNREMCPDCGAPVRPIPVPPNGKIRFGEYDWFVLDKKDDKMLIITEKVIGKRAYHHCECEITWETCDMRKFLNTEFYNSFTSEDRKRIVEVTNENPDNPWYSGKGGNSTVDRVFLLSIDEVLKYFGDSGQIKTRYMYPSPVGDWCKDEFLPWIDDEYNVNRRAVNDDGVVDFYKLRSPGFDNRRVAHIMGFCGDGYDQGCIAVSGNCEFSDGHFYFDCDGGLTKPDGIRPALWLKLR